MMMELGSESRQIVLIILIALMMAVPVTVTMVWLKSEMNESKAAVSASVSVSVRVDIAWSKKGYRSCLRVLVLAAVTMMNVMNVVVEIGI